jgi:WhiB family redox-sensing transcriptional regulator
MDPGIFVGPDGEANSDREFRETEAKLVCVGCPLREECLSWAVDLKEVGIWGGTNDEERKVIRDSDPNRPLRTQSRVRLERERTAWVLATEEGLTRIEIAKRLGVTEPTVSEYMRSQKRKVDQNVQADQDPDQAATDEAGHESRSSDSVRESATAVLGAA